MQIQIILVIEGVFKSFNAPSDISSSKNIVIVMLWTERRQMQIVIVF